MSRLIFAATAATALATAVVIAALADSSDPDAATSDNECILAWNDDPLARGDGLHALRAHSYSAAYVTRVDQRGRLLEPDARTGRCVVVFASPVVDREPDFGVRVHDAGRWAGLALTDRVPLDEIEVMQKDALNTANATVLPDGQLADR